ncbi:MAG: glycogen debranching enzyme N-terminal domain-containing protein [Saprospiraceae bacterium]|nr:glycogen debranching enzyme N-terminal domain-containing protein [Saprospiraceae bacterium]
MLSFSQAGFEDLSAKEWLVTNGLGGYASSSLSGANTRRYHGLDYREDSFSVGSGCAQQAWSVGMLVLAMAKVQESVLTPITLSI